jgi:protein-disulfide isomerase
MLLERAGAGLQPGSRYSPEQAPPQAVSKAAIPLGSEYVLGSKDAPVTIVEFSDYQCGFCRRFHSQTFSEIRKKYIETGRVRFVSRDLPLDVTTPSLRAAEAVRCAGEQQRYWEVREAILMGPPRLTNEIIRAQAANVPGLDLAKFDACVESANRPGPFSATLNRRRR